MTSQGGSSSSITPEKKCRRCRRTRRRLIRCHLLGFFSTLNSLTALPPDASPRILWSHWLHHHLSWVFMISLKFQRLHHHLMHLLGFCDLNDCIRWHLLGFYGLIHCITTWCISWDFMISLTTSPLASPPNASPEILWSQSLHHHLHHHMMHLLGFYVLTHYITTWCISWDFVISLIASPLVILLTTSPPNASPH